MQHNFKKHPSDIPKAAHKFLEGLEVKDTSKHCEVLELFVSYLTHDGSSCEETDDGEFVLTANWKDYYGQVMDSFINFFMIRNVASDAKFRKKSVSVMKQFVKWSYKQKYFDKEHYDEYMNVLDGSSNEDIDRVEKLNDLFYKLHSPNQGAWARSDVGEVESINNAARAEEIEEGYMTFKRASGTTGFFKPNDSKANFGPVMLCKEIVDLLKVGDTVNLTIGRYGKTWRVLETGNVYAAGTGALS